MDVSDSDLTGEIRVENMYSHVILGCHKCNLPQLVRFLHVTVFCTDTNLGIVKDNIRITTLSSLLKGTVFRLPRPLGPPIC